MLQQKYKWILKGRQVQLIKAHFRILWFNLLLCQKTGSLIPLQYYRVFSHDVTAAILVSQNNETVAMLVSQTSPVGVELFSYANNFFSSTKLA